MTTNTITSRRTAIRSTNRRSDYDCEKISSSSFHNHDDVPMIPGQTMLEADRNKNSKSDKRRTNENHGWDENKYSAHWALYPREYVAPRISDDMNFVEKIDGRVLDKELWKNIPWSDTFNDIQGTDCAPPTMCSSSSSSSSPVGVGLTKFKAMYDSTHLYIGAILYPAYNLSTEAHYTERNSPIFQMDSDYEIFVDASNTNHNYKELEINAINTVWNLMLDRPYGDGGMEHSGRVTTDPNDPKYYEVYNQKTATVILDGTINRNESSGGNSGDSFGALWSVEFALAYTDLQATTARLAEKLCGTAIDATTSTEQRNRSTNNITVVTTPSVGDHWRINFSRVERQGKINWTWQPQWVYDPILRRYGGFIDMHRPDAWGYFYFGEDTANTPMATTTSSSSSSSSSQGQATESFHRDATWPAKLTAMTIYYALHHYKDNNNGTFTKNVDDLLLPEDIIKPFDLIDIELYTTTSKINSRSSSHAAHDGDEQHQFLVTVFSSDDGLWATVRTDRYLQVDILPANDGISREQLRRRMVSSKK
jgi:hypothetical protein